MSTADPLFLVNALTEAILDVQERQGALGTYGDPPLRGKISEEADALICQAAEDGVFGPMKKVAPNEILIGSVIFLGVPFQIIPQAGVWFLLDISPIREKP